MSGSDALVYVTEHTPSAVILDYMMPEMDGLEVLRRMRKMGGGLATMPVVLYTAARDNWLRDEALALGAREVWPKSQITFSEMHQRLMKLLDNADTTSPLPGKSNPVT